MSHTFKDPDINCFKKRKEIYLGQCRLPTPLAIRDNTGVVQLEHPNNKSSHFYKAGDNGEPGTTQGCLRRGGLGWRPSIGSFQS